MYRKCQLRFDRYPDVVWLDYFWLQTEYYEQSYGLYWIEHSIFALTERQTKAIILPIDKSRQVGHRKDVSSMLDMLQKGNTRLAESKIIVKLLSPDEAKRQLFFVRWDAEWFKGLSKGKLRVHLTS